MVKLKYFQVNASELYIPLIPQCNNEETVEVSSSLVRGSLVLAPVVWGIRIQPTFALVRVVRGD